ncbi:ladderlectin-like [Lingula anatina]|uniref:Ladderlectin-like n=1 Tax=Lingula anatina TaxID=7574 RepID=A0A1S3JZ26_LINAN|nr:ladderlectin-like [Lingula anatina]|eukprot:XP_013415552.1 ladderlectin-like [Lingula anatina]
MVKVPKPCPQGFQQFGSSCYYFKSVGGSALSWDQARTKCRSLSADLVSIETKEEHEFIKKNLKPITTPNIFQGWYVGGKRRTVDPATGRPWTAAQNANKAEMKKQYYWVATGKTMAYDGWEKSKADIPNVQPVGDPCVLLWVGRSDFLDYEFDDYVCASNYPNIGYVCEKTN